MSRRSHPFPFPRGSIDARVRRGPSCSTLGGHEPRVTATEDHEGRKETGEKKNGEGLGSRRRSSRGERVGFSFSESKAH